MSLISLIVVSGLSQEKVRLLVEIGSFAGESTKVFLDVGLHVHAIDP